MNSINESIKNSFKVAVILLAVLASWLHGYDRGHSTVVPSRLPANDPHSATEALKTLAYDLPPITKANVLVVLAAHASNREYELGHVMIQWAASQFGRKTDEFISTNLTSTNQ